MRKMEFLRRKKKHTKSNRRWRLLSKNKKMKEDKEMQKIKKLLKLNTPKPKINWIWILLLNTFRRNGTGSKPKENSWPRREREVRVKERKRRSELHGLFRY